MTQRAANRSTGDVRRPRFAPHLAARLFVVSVAILLAAACNSLRVGYNNADTLLTYTLNSYLDLDESQQQLARDSVRSLLDWHRRTQLVEYVQWIDATQAKLERPVDTRQVLDFTLGFNQRLGAVGDHAAPSLAALALTLRPEQIGQLEKKLAKDLGKARREVVKFSGADAIGERTRRYAERADDWFGSLSDTQLALIRDSLAARAGGDAWWLEERAQRHKDLVDLVRRIHHEQPDQETAARWARAYLLSLREPRAPERLMKIQAWRSGNAELVSQLINTASAPQKQHLLKKLRGYSEDFSALAHENGRG